MKASYYFKRIINDKVKLLFISFLFIMPIIDLILTFIYVPKGLQIPQSPDFNSFLASIAAESHTFHTLMIHFLPVFLLVIAGDDCFEDAKTGYRSVLISKWGKKSYVRTNIVKAFCISFFIILISLMLNLLMAHIIYNGAISSHFDEWLLYEKETSLIYIEVNNPLITNVCYIFATALLAGLIGAAGAALAMAIKNRKIVYPLLYAFWYLASSMDKSIILSLQPFTEYGLDTKVPAYITTACIFLAVIVVAAIKEKRFAKI